MIFFLFSSPQCDFDVVHPNWLPAAGDRAGRLACLYGQGGIPAPVGSQERLALSVKSSQRL